MSRATMTNEELQAVLASVPQTPAEFMAGLEAVDEVMQRIADFVETTDLTDGEIDQLRHGLEGLVNELREFAGEVRRQEVAA